MSEMIERGADALERAEIGYSLRLTRLVDGVSTYTLTYDDGTPPIEFGDNSDAYANISAKKRLRAAMLAIASIEAAGYAIVPARETVAILSAGQKAWNDDPAKLSSTLYRAMIEAGKVRP